MLDMTVNNFFDDDDDDFFAEAVRSISKIESSKQEPQFAKCLATTNLDNDGKENCEKTTDYESSSSIIKSINRKSKTSTTACSEVKSDVNEKFFSHDSNEANSNDIIYKTINEDSIFNNENSTANHRFTLGFTPKARKRKFPGPAGCIIEEPTQSVSNDEPVLKKLSTSESESISSSQFSVEDLLQSVSWRKLQEDVSSHSGLLSIAKNFSIQRVLDDTSKKKLPKHVVVPVLCVFIKKFNPEESTSVYLDDTGEINGKVEEEVLTLYKECSESGTALILQNVTFMCNVMLLKNSNLVTIYLKNGAVQHVINWDELIKKRPLNPLSCICPVTPKLEKASSILKNIKSEPIISCKNSLLQIKQNKNLSYSSFSKTNALNLSSPLSRSDDSGMKILQNSSTADDHTLENDAMDDFDELLGSLDEKSFLGDF